MMQTWRLVRLYFVNPLTGNKLNKWMVFDRQDREVCSRDTRREAVLAGLMRAKLDGVAVEIVGDTDEPIAKNYLTEIASRLRKFAGTLRGPDHDAAREAAVTIETLATAATHVVKSIDNWEKVQPLNPQIKQDVDVLRSFLQASAATSESKGTE
jgi:hypothetical protein